MHSSAIDKNQISNVSFFNPAAALEEFKKKTSSPNFIAFSFALAIHLLLLAIIFYNNKSENQPILSFTVTMMDISATSSNVVASDSSMASNEKSRANIKVDENQNSPTNLTKNNKESLEQNSESTKKSAQLHNSNKQSAVIAPFKQAVFDAAYLHNDAPTYPALSRQFEEQGTVLLNVLVDINGKAQDVIIKKSSGFSRLDNAALKTVKKWNFIPAKQDEKMLESWVQVPVGFVLEN